MSGRDERMKHEAKRIVELIRGGNVYGLPIDGGAINKFDLDDMDVVKFILAIHGAAQTEYVNSLAAGRALWTNLMT